MEGEHKHRLGVIIGPKAYRNSQEIELFRGLSDFSVTFVGSTVERPPNLDGENYNYAKVKKVVPDFLGDFLVRKPYSPTSFIKMDNLEKCLKETHVINSVEVYSFASMQCARIARKNGKKLSVNVYETLPEMPFHHVPPFSWNMKSVLKQTDGFLPITHKAAECLRQLSAPDEKIRVIHPGIDIEMFSPGEDPYHSSFRILYVGRFDPEKGLLLLLEAFLRLHSDTPNVELWVVGEPRTDEKVGVYLKALAEKYPVRVIGYVEHDSLPEIYRKCDVLCLPSYDREKWGVKVWEEQFGFVLVEAMACGLPIVATDCGAISEIIGKGNVIVSQKSVNVLYEALKELLENEKSRRYIGKANRTRAVQLFDIEKQRIKMDKALWDLLWA